MNIGLPETEKGEWGKIRQPVDILIYFIYNRFMLKNNCPIRFIVIVIMIAALVSCSQEKTSKNLPPYKNHKLDIEKRIDDLISRMTLEEKVSQMVYNSPAIERLDIPGYNWWNEALHGVARAGLATVFPQAIGLAAAWDPQLMVTVGGDGVWKPTVKTRILPDEWQRH